MMFELLVVLAGVAGFAYLITHARQFADLPRRGTEWRPSYRTYVLLAFAPLLMAVGALMDLLAN